MIYDKTLLGMFTIEIQFQIKNLDGLTWHSGHIWSALDTGPSLSGLDSFLSRWDSKQIHNELRINGQIVRVFNEKNADFSQILNTTKIE